MRFQLLLSILILSSAAFADFTETGRDYRDDVHAEQLMDSLYGPGNWERIHDYNSEINDQEWEIMLDGDITIKGKYAGFRHEFGFKNGSTGGSFKRLYYIADNRGLFQPEEQEKVYIRNDSATFRFILRLPDIRPYGRSWEWSSRPSDNYRNQDHVITFRITGNATYDGAPFDYSKNNVGMFVLCWEDLDHSGRFTQESDKDYGDLIVELPGAKPVDFSSEIEISSSESNSSSSEAVSSDNGLSSNIVMESSSSELHVSSSQIVPSSSYISSSIQDPMSSDIPSSSSNPISSEVGHVSSSSFTVGSGDCGDYGALNMGEGEIKLFYRDLGWTGHWAYLCKNNICYPTESENGFYEKTFNGNPNEVFSFTFRVQDNHTGQFEFNDVVTVMESCEESSSSESSSDEAVSSSSEEDNLSNDGMNSSSAGDELDNGNNGNSSDAGDELDNGNNGESSDAGDELDNGNNGESSDAGDELDNGDNGSSSDAGDELDNGNNGESSDAGDELDNGDNSSSSDAGDELDNGNNGESSDAGDELDNGNNGESSDAGDELDNGDNGSSSDAGDELDNGNNGESSDAGDELDNGNNGSSSDAGDELDNGNNGESSDAGDELDNGNNGESSDAGDELDNGNNGESSDAGDELDNGNNGSSSDAGDELDNGNNGESSDAGDELDNGNNGESSDAGDELDNGNNGESSDAGDELDNGNNGDSSDAGDELDNGSNGDSSDSDDELGNDVQNSSSTEKDELNNDNSSSSENDSDTMSSDENGGHDFDADGERKDGDMKDEDDQESSSSIDITITLGDENMSSDVKDIDLLSSSSSIELADGKGDTDEQDEKDGSENSSSDSFDMDFGNDGNRVKGDEVDKDGDDTEKEINVDLADVWEKEDVQRIQVSHIIGDGSDTIVIQYPDDKNRIDIGDTFIINGKEIEVDTSFTDVDGQHRVVVDSDDVKDAKDSDMIDMDQISLNIEGFEDVILELNEVLSAPTIAADLSGYFDSNEDGKMDQVKLIFSVPTTGAVLKHTTMSFTWLNNNNKVVTVTPDLSGYTGDNIKEIVWNVPDSYNLKENLTAVNYRRYGLAQIKFQSMVNDVPFLFEEEIFMNDYMAPVITKVELVLSTDILRGSDSMHVEFSEELNKEYILSEELFVLKQTEDISYLKTADLTWHKENAKVSFPVVNDEFEKIYIGDSLKLTFFDSDYGIVHDMFSNYSSELNQYYLIEGEPRATVSSVNFSTLNVDEEKIKQLPVSELKFIDPETKDEQIKNEEALGHVIELDANVFPQALKSISEGKYTTDDLNIYYKVNYYNKSGFHLGEVKGVINCADESFYGDCLENPKLAFIKWNYKTEDNKVVSTGAYIAQMTLIIVTPESSSRTSYMDTWGVSRVEQ